MFIPLLSFGMQQELDKPTTSLSAFVFIAAAQKRNAYPVFVRFSGGDGDWQPSRRL